MCRAMLSMLRRNEGTSTTLLGSNKPSEEEGAAEDEAAEKGFFTEGIEENDMRKKEPNTTSCRGREMDFRNRILPSCASAPTLALAPDKTDGEENPVDPAVAVVVAADEVVVPVPVSEPINVPSLPAPTAAPVGETAAVNVEERISEFLRARSCCWKRTAALSAAERVSSAIGSTLPTGSWVRQE